MIHAALINIFIAHAHASHYCTNLFIPLHCDTVLLKHFPISINIDYHYIIGTIIITIFRMFSHN